MENTCVRRGLVTIVIIAMIDKIKEFIDEITGTIEWLLAGCPKPVPIPVKDDKHEPKESI